MKRRGFLASVFGGLAAMLLPFKAAQSCSIPFDGCDDTVSTFSFGPSRESEEGWNHITIWEKPTEIRVYVNGECIALAATTDGSPLSRERKNTFLAGVVFDGA